jgi:hypothetical protein
MPIEEIRAVKAWYPAFHLGCEPRAIECEIRLVAANGKRYVKTPFAMLDAFSDDDPERMIDGRGYYATEAECAAYLAAEYPWWKQAAPIMDAICANTRLSNLGAGAVADKCGVSFDDVYPLARGHKRFSLKQVRKAVANV